MSPPRACIVCSSPTTQGSRCERHAYASNWAPRTAASPYRGAWTAIRKRQLEREPNCRECGAPATDADHVIPLSKGGTHDPSNLHSLCRKHHRSKTGREGHAARKAKR